MKCQPGFSFVLALFLALAVSFFSQNTQSNRVEKRGR